MIGVAISNAAITPRPGVPSGEWSVLSDAKENLDQVRIYSTGQTAPPELSSSSSSSSSLPSELN